MCIYNYQISSMLYMYNIYMLYIYIYVYMCISYICVYMYVLTSIVQYKLRSLFQKAVITITEHELPMSMLSSKIVF